MPKSKKQHTSKKHNVIKESFDTDNETFVDDGNISETSLDHLILRNEEPVFDTKFININDDGVLNGPKTNKELGNGKKIPLNRIVKNNVHVTQTHDNDSNLFRECAINSKTPNASEALDEKYAMLQKSLSQDTKDNFKNYNKEDIEQTNIAPQENTNKYNINNNDDTNNYVNEANNIERNNEQKQITNTSPNKEQQMMNSSITNDQKLSMSDYDISNINNINHNKNVNKEAFSIINKDNDIVEINAAYTGPYKLNKSMFRKCYIILIILILISILLLAFFVNYKKYLVKKNEEKDNDINNSNNKLVKDISRENNNILQGMNKQSAFSGGDTNNYGDINNEVSNNDVNNNSDQLINDLFNSSNNDNTINDNTIYGTQKINDNNYVHKLNVTNHSNAIDETPKLNIKNNNRPRDKHGRFIKIK